MVVQRGGACGHSRWRRECARGPHRLHIRAGWGLASLSLDGTKADDRKAGSHVPAPLHHDDAYPAVMSSCRFLLLLRYRTSITPGPWSASRRPPGANATVHTPASPYATPANPFFVHLQAAEQNGSAAVEQEVAAGLRTYFDKALCAVLLYRSERPQVGMR